MINRSISCRVVSSRLSNALQRPRTPWCAKKAAVPTVVLENCPSGISPNQRCCECRVNGRKGGGSVETVVEGTGADQANPFVLSRAQQRSIRVRRAEPGLAACCRREHGGYPRCHVRQPSHPAVAAARPALDRAEPVLDGSSPQAHSIGHSDLPGMVGQTRRWPVSATAPVRADLTVNKVDEGRRDRMSTFSSCRCAKTTDVEPATAFVAASSGCRANGSSARVKAVTASSTSP